MSKKAQIGLGAIILSTIAILVGLALYSGSLATSIGVLTQTASATNSTVAMPAAGSSVELTACGQKVLTGVVVNTTGPTIPATNYSFTQAAGTDGYLSAYLTGAAGLYGGETVNVSCTSYEPKGYVADGGSRAIIALIAIFMALLIVVAAIPQARNGVLDFFSR